MVLATIALLFALSLLRLSAPSFRHLPPSLQDLLLTSFLASQSPGFVANLLPSLCLQDLLLTSFLASQSPGFIICIAASYETMMNCYSADMTLLACTISMETVTVKMDVWNA